ncbi:MAG TPA: ATP-binding protein [Anaerolineales bacterium]|nr:ATP-binding protein [Anaerolineales bacterium]
MKSESNASILVFLRRYASAANLIVVVASLMVLSGWLLNIPLLKSLLPGLPAMRFNTALSLLLVGISLWLLKDEETDSTKNRLGLILIGLVLLLNLLTLSEYLFGWNLGIDEFFVKDLDSPPELYPGRIAPLAILCACLSSVSLLRFGSRLSRYFSYSVMALSFLIILNNLFDFQLLFRSSEQNAVPASTGAAFLILSSAMIAARPTQGLMRMFLSNLPGSRALRLLLPWIITLTISMAWLIEQGERLGILDPGKEFIFLVIVLIFTYSPLIYFIAKNINEAGAKLLVSDQILERVNALVLVADARGSVSYVSPSVKTILGFEPSELLGDGWRKISRSSPAEATAEKERIVSRAGQGEMIGPVPYEREIQDRWGNTHWIMWVDALGPDSSIIGVGHDVTERKRAEQELRQNEMRYRQAIIAANAIPYSLDYSANQYTFIGEGIAELTGFSAEEFTPALLDSLIIESVMQGGYKGIPTREAIERIRQGRSTSLWKCDYRIHTRSGEERWLSDASIQVTDEEGIPTGSVGIFRDITDRTKSEQALRQSEQELRVLSEALEQRVVARTADLRRVNLELEKVSRAKDEFLANMSHELRTPLNSILGLSELLLEQIRGPLNEYQQKTLRIVESSGQHLLSLINDILDLSKIEAGKLQLHPETIEVLRICEASLAFVREQAVKKSIALEFEPRQANHTIAADPRYLKQILVNLLTNAVKFTPAQGHVALEVITDAEHGLIQFSVRDTGIGIAPDNLSQLFRPFVQVESSLNRQYEGTGLGLALVQRLADLHGGSVQVESDGVPGKGSCFTVSLPWQPDIASPQKLVEDGAELSASAPLEIAGVVSNMPVSSKRILLVEDNPANVLTIGEYLENKNFSVMVAHNGLEALARASELNPNIILMDIQMPVMDGLEATRRLRADPRFRSVPIIALTALAMPGDRERCLQAGASEYVCKPVNLKQLVKMIEHLTGHGE